MNRRAFIGGAATAALGTSAMVTPVFAAQPTTSLSIDFLGLSAFVREKTADPTILGRLSVLVAAVEYSSLKDHVKPHLAYLRIPVEDVENPADFMKDPSDPSTLRVPLGGTVVQFLYDGQTSSDPVSARRSISNGGNWIYEACPGNHQWKDTFWMIDFKGVLGNYTVNPSYLADNALSKTVVASRIELRHGRLECDRPTTDTAAKSSLAFVVPSGGGSQDIYRQCFTDVVRFVSSPAETITINFQPFGGGSPQPMKLKSRADLTSPIQAFVENLPDPKASDPIMPEAHFKVVYDFISSSYSSRLTYTSPKDCMTKADLDFPIFCPPPLM